jgi:hypothetical protein
MPDIRHTPETGAGFNVELAYRKARVTYEQDKVKIPQGVSYVIVHYDNHAQWGDDEYTLWWSVSVGEVMSAPIWQTRTRGIQAFAVKIESDEAREATLKVKIETQWAAITGGAIKLKSINAATTDGEATVRGSLALKPTVPPVPTPEDEPPKPDLEHPSVHEPDRGRRVTLMWLRGIRDLLTMTIEEIEAAGKPPVPKSN